jgi:hypothetical protein
MKQSFSQAFRSFVKGGYVGQDYDPNASSTSQKLFLRGRSGFASAEKTPQQEIKDAIIADLFSFKPLNDQEGVNNSVYLDQLRNEEMQTRNANVFPETMNTLGFDELPISRTEPPQYTVEAPGTLSATQGNTYQPNPYSNDMSFSSFVYVDQQPGPMSYDTSNPLPVMYSNVLGFKPTYDPLRFPLVPK